MRFKPFFVHFNNSRALSFTRILKAGYKSRPRGFTLYVQPSEHPQKILVSGAWCSYKDQFCKATGRQQAQHHADIKEINARHLGQLVTAMHSTVTGYDVDASGYDYLYKYMV